MATAGVMIPAARMTDLHTDCCCQEYCISVVLHAMVTMDSVYAAGFRLNAIALLRAPTTPRQNRALASQQVPVRLKEAPAELY